MRSSLFISRSALKRKLSTTAPSSRLTLSAVEGPLEPPLVSKTLPAYFRDDILRPHGSRPALIARQEQVRPHGGPRSRNLGDAAHLAWDFGEFDRHIQALARGLLDLGVKKGDRVGVIMGNNRCVAVVQLGLLWRSRLARDSAYACLQWACASVGAILVTLNPAYRLPELVCTPPRSSRVG